MNTTIDHQASFGTADQVFRQTDEMITALERIAGKGIGSIYAGFICG